MRFILFSAFLLLSITTIFSQQRIVYKGTVKDATTQESIPFATIALYTNNKLVDGVSTNDDGQFEIKTRKNITHFEISFIGYRTSKINITEIQNPQSVRISLQPVSQELDEVVIQAERTTSELKIDRKIINLGVDLQQSGATALEAFDQIPEIQTDLAIGTLTLRGSGNVRLLVNGKPFPLSATELLDQIPVSSIQRVEIITSPSAKNQADGISGIINIVLKKSLNRGLNLTLNSSVGTKRHQYGFDTNYNMSSVNFRLNASQGKRRMDSKQWISQLFSSGSTRDFFAPHDFNGEVSRISSGVDFFINEKNELSFQVDYTNDYHSFFNDTFYTNVSNTPDYVYTRNSSHTHKTIVYNANYRRMFVEEGHFLELDYNLNKNKNILPATDFESGIFLFDELQSNENDLHAFAFDYSLPINKVQLEAGLSWNYRKLKSDKTFTPNTGAASFDIFNYKENLVGVYGLVKFVYGALHWQTGVRYEYFKSDSDNTANNQKTDLKFSNLFPSIHMSYKLSEENTFNMGYSKRISRPNFHHINPFQIGSQYFQWNANPALKPELADNLEVNYQYEVKKFSMSLATFYRYRTDVIQWVDTINSDGVRIVSFENHGNRNSYGIESNIQYKIANYWNTQLSANYYYTKVNQSNVTWNNIYSSSIIAKNTFKISKTLSTDITYRYTPKNQNVYSITQPRNRIDWAVVILAMLVVIISSSIAATTVINN